MKKQDFFNGSIKSKKIQKIKTPVEKLVERLERTTSIVDFYAQKQKILELLRETRK